MTPLRFDHIGIVVPDLAPGRDFFNTAFPITRWTASVDDPGLGVSVQFALDASGLVYELIAPLGPASPVAGALSSGRNLLNHIAYRTTDLVHAAAHLASTGCRETAPARPALAYGNAPVQFFLSPLRFIIELIEAPAHEHRWQPFDTLTSAA